MKLKLTEEQIRKINQEELCEIAQDNQITSIIEYMNMTHNEEDRLNCMNLLLIHLTIDKLINILERIRPFSINKYTIYWGISGLQGEEPVSWAIEKELIDCLWEAIVERKEDLMENNDEYDY